MCPLSKVNAYFPIPPLIMRWRYSLFPLLLGKNRHLLIIKCNNYICLKLCLFFIVDVHFGMEEVPLLVKL